MGALSKVLVILMFSGLGVTAYAGSVMGWGMGSLRSPSTQAQIKKNCPGYYQSPDGDCLRRTYRSYFLVRGLRGGGFGGGK